MAYMYFILELCLDTKEINCTKPWYFAHVVFVDVLLQEEDEICRQCQGLG